MTAESWLETTGVVLAERIPLQQPGGGLAPQAAFSIDAVERLRNMGASFAHDLAHLLDDVVEEARARVAAFQVREAEKRREVDDRFQKFLPIANQIVPIVRKRIEQR